MALQVRLESSEFSTHGHYFVSVQLDELTDAKRTEVSDNTSNPLFISNLFQFPLPNGSL